MAAADLDESGYCVLRGFWSPEETAFLRARSDSFGRAAESILKHASASNQSPALLAREHPDSLIVVAEAHDPLQVCRFEYLLGADAEFRDFATRRIAPAIAAVLREAVLPFKDKENEKHPGGGAFRPHQDFAAYQAFGPRYNATAMLTIDPATAENGCLQFATNFRDVASELTSGQVIWFDGRALLDFHQGGSQNGDIRNAIAGLLDWQIVPTVPEDLVIFDSFAPHRSEPNRTTTSRRAMFVTYNREREGDWYARYYAEKRANYADPKFHVSTPTVHAGL